MPENKQFTDHLKVQFTEDEVRKKGVELAQTMGEADQLEIEKKGVVSDYKGRIDAKLTIIKKLKDEVNNGHAYLPVRCEVRFNEPENGKATVYRLDSGEVVNVRDMTGDERQIKITDFLEHEQADSPFETTKEEKSVLKGEPAADITPDRYTSEEFVKHFQNTTVGLDADKFGFPAGAISKMANKKKIKILRQDHTGTIFTMGEMADGVIFFDKNTVPEIYTSVEIIDGRIKQLEDAIKTEPDSAGVEAWQKEIVDLQGKRAKLAKKKRSNKEQETKPEPTPPGEGDDAVNPGPTKAEAKAAAKQKEAFIQRPAEWFTERIGKEIEAKNENPKKFNGVMTIDDQAHAEYLASVSQNEGKFTYRDVQ